MATRTEPMRIAPVLCQRRRGGGAGLSARGSARGGVVVAGRRGLPSRLATRLPLGGTRPGKELPRPLLALRGQPVDDLRPAARQRAARDAGLLLRDQALGE